MYQANSDLLQVLEVTARTLPGLSGRVGASGRDELACGAADNPARIAALYRHWQFACPEAGVHYWTARTWTLLIWQPIYLSLLGVHLAGRLPSLQGMGQSVCEGVVSGFCLPEHAPRRAHEDALIGLAAEQLRQLLERQLLEFDAVVAIHHKLARRLQADYVLAALLLIQRQRALDNARLHELEQRWLTALGLQGGSSLIEVRLDDGRARLALGRKVCCQHFRRADGQLCSTCPKLKQDERMTRLRRELSLECCD
ncbi:siderophore ferric iron reductase [Phytopseudomonas dryadis]|uniref:Siderophore ferric iron reductase n=1 Tax=Phytopseudomonas dryadis TaxID=2487520 RepID=A0A4Q9R1D8_9GAMM|nr:MULTISPECIES: siderophore ferric iron reductase [Pseudomonas]TBU90894.1 siderophore ferric iron reductase [Pseudomonas dryadis]TBV08950.1 siderophore ferric iron reductase [Pseudomonas dryadis]TBV15135.1 siderophore ferric iron reductase [Pseudomonas sp. FRB 230]